MGLGGGCRSIMRGGWRLLIGVSFAPFLPGVVGYGVRNWMCRLIFGYGEELGEQVLLGMGYFFFFDSEDTWEEKRKITMS